MRMAFGYLVEMLHNCNNAFHHMPFPRLEAPHLLTADSGMYK